MPKREKSFSSSAEENAHKWQDICAFHTDKISKCELGRSLELSCYLHVPRLWASPDSKLFHLIFCSSGRMLHPFLARVLFSVCSMRFAINLRNFIFQRFDGLPPSAVAGFHSFRVNADGASRTC